MDEIILKQRIIQLEGQLDAATMEQDRLIKICRLKDERIAAAEGEAKALARINEELQQRVDVIESPDRDALIRLSRALHLI
jgi:hypothetical protein